MPSRNARFGGCVIIAILLLATVVALTIGGFSWFAGKWQPAPVPGQQRCVATAGDGAVALSLDQAHYASIIAALSVKRGLPPRASSIALATAYQESGIRNLDYGDRDSVGLFQQRPSQGWGTEKQLMDPHFATGKFYDALVKVSNWRTRDITEVAQKVQVSGHPEAYRDHENDARVLASTLTGETPAGFTCLDRTGAEGSPQGMSTALTKSFGAAAKPSANGKVLKITAGSKDDAWAYAAFAIANSAQYGTVQVVVGDQQWDTNAMTLPGWVNAEDPAYPKQVRITLR